MRPDEIIARQVKVEDEQGKELYNDLGTAGFKVAGIGKRIKHVIESIRVAATKRRRKSLLSEKDEVPGGAAEQQSTE